MSLFKQLPIALDITNIEHFISKEELGAVEPQVKLCDTALRNGTCQGSAFTGWLSPETILTAEEKQRIKAKAEYLRNNSDVLLVIGIGGSYLGSRAVIEALSEQPERVIFAGQTISAEYTARLKKKLAGKRVAINVISKSGTTTEPAIALRIFEDLVSDRSLMAVTTDKAKGALLEYANSEGIDTFVVPDNIGGRYSVLSAVGLIPIQYAGIDIDRLTLGAVKAAAVCRETDFEHNPAYIYAAARHILQSKGYITEIFSAFEPQFLYISEWWKQLFGESEGKDNTGIFPASCIFSTDLHSMGQYIQEGRRNIFETFVIVENIDCDLSVPYQKNNTDQMNYLAEKQVKYVNRMAYEATAKAHTDGGVPNMTVILERQNEEALGALIYFYEISCAVSCLLLGVNPFNQPGVEAYKQYMFRLLCKPGYEPLVINNDNKTIIGC